MRTSKVTRIWPTVVSWAYVAGVGVLAGVGFIGQSPWLILLAALLAVPVSLVAMPCFYVAYGLLAQIPGANPSTSTGSAAVSTDGASLWSVTTGSTASWFTITTHVLGIVTLVVAATLNVRLARGLRARMRRGACRESRARSLVGVTAGGHRRLRGLPRPVASGSCG